MALKHSAHMQNTIPRYDWSTTEAGREWFSPMEKNMELMIHVRMILFTLYVAL